MTMNVNCKHLLIFVVIGLFVGLCAAKKTSKYLNFIEVNVTFNRDYLQDHRVDIVTRKTVNVVLTVAKDYTTDPWVSIALSKRDRKTNDYQVLLQHDLNVCSFLGKQSGNYLVTWMQNFLKYGNLPKTCPILKGNYSWLNLKVDQMSIPPFISAAFYKIRIDTYFRLQPVPDPVANISLIMEYK